jgi:pimeloyl-ACP methyl ester carboxylesterase/DNA-binding winged helix-turn-helix (wHTH) protein
MTGVLAPTLESLEPRSSLPCHQGEPARVQWQRNSEQRLMLAPGSTQLAFGPFRLEPGNARLWRGDRPVALQPKALTVLHFLAERAGRLVTKDELLDAGWPGVFVGDAALKVCIREIRRALDDDAARPTYVETVHRRGYRFISPVNYSATLSAPLLSGVLATTPPSSPETRYARSGDVNIAYQVVGNGPVDLVFVMGWVSHLDYFWTEPSFAAFLKRLASFSRLILFDKRGTGLSDPVAELPTLERRMDDVRAVLEAAESTDAVLFGVSEGGPMCALFAATYPERTRGLVMFGTYAKRLWSPDYPWAPTSSERERFHDEIRDHWGGPVGIDDRAPSRAQDPTFRNWWATYLRMGASPGTALSLSRMNAEVDVRSVLPTIQVPTMVLHRRGDRCLKIDEGRYVAERIPGAVFVELDGDDHLPFVGDQDQLVSEVERFVRNTATRLESTRMLATVLVADECGPIAAYPAAAGQFIVEAKSRLDAMRGHVQTTATGLLAAFDGPARAITAARSLATLADSHGLRFRIGLHTGECEVGQRQVRGLAVEIARQVASHATPGEVLASRTLRDLVAGSGIRFRDRGERPLGPHQEPWHVFSV